MHIPVLLHEVIDGLELTAGSIAVDATVGGGGYSKAMCDIVGKTGRVIGFDEDAAALERGVTACASCMCVFTPVHSNFRYMKDRVRELGIEHVDGIAFDLGFSSFQIEGSGRGFSFLRDEPLVMTFAEDGARRPFTAHDIVNSWDEEVIANILFGYGEERFSRRIAKAIVEARTKGAIDTTMQLVDTIKAAVPGVYRNGPLHPATRSFQALRIAVNDELGALTDGLVGAYELVRPGGRIAVVSFHSIEDRIVKNFFRDKAHEGIATLITKKPIDPSDDEVRMNPRARSAKLRIIQKLEARS